MGSTEHVEDNIDRFRAGGVAYINVDVGVSGPDALLRAAASPVWQRPLLHALGRVSDPGSDKSLRETWEARNTVLEGLGAHGDYVAFQHMAGMSSIDLGFAGERDAVQGSCYDTFQYMEKLDPGFNYHRALAQVWALLILEVADQPLLPLDLRAYAIAIKNDYMHDLEAFIDEQKHRPDQATSNSSLDLAPLYAAADLFMSRADHFHSFEDEWTRLVYSNNGIESRQLGNLRIKFNNALANFETDLLDLPAKKNDKGQYGAEGREQYKHVILGPTSQSEDVGYFPMIRDAILKGDWALAQEMVVKTATILQRAVDNLPLPEKIS